MLTFRRRVVTKRIILHDSHTPPSQSNLKAYLEVKGRTMGLLEPGYHYLITRDRGTWALRPHDTIGAHCPGYDRESIGVVLAGGMSEELVAHDGEARRVPEDNFTPQQMQDLRDLVAYLRDCYGPIRLEGHTEMPRHTRHPHPCPPLDMHEMRHYVDN